MPMLPSLRSPSIGLPCVTGEVSVRPKPSMIRAPVSCSKRCSTSTGSGAEPEKQDFTQRDVHALDAGKLLIAANIAGTPMKSVTRCFVTAVDDGRDVARVRQEDHRAAGEDREVHARPSSRRRGRAAARRGTTSSAKSAMCSHAMALWTLPERLRCVSIAPFATPVVPPVYCSTAMSSSPIATAGGFGRRAVHQRPEVVHAAARPHRARYAGGVIRLQLEGRQQVEREAEVLGDGGDDVVLDVELVADGPDARARRGSRRRSPPRSWRRTTGARSRAPRRAGWSSRPARPRTARA